MLFRHVTHTQQALLADQTGVVRGSVVRAVLQEACLQPQVPHCLPLALALYCFFVVPKHVCVTPD